VILITSCQAENTEPVAREIAEYVWQRLAIPTRYVDDIDWPERYRRLNRGDIDIGWICGLPYVRRMELRRPGITLLAAPVMKGERYQDEPIYFSDVVVRAESPFQSFSDLAGASWAYNEPGSQSGFAITQYHLACLGETWAYFAGLIESGAHRNSLEMILEGRVDASAIDSTYLEWRLYREPQLRSRIRVIAALGPSPMPPWIVSTRVPPTVSEAVRQLLLDMANEPKGRAILDIGHIARFAAVTDQTYDPIRHMRGHP
jgi:phosphonate transport system substrate-binding protein